LNTGHRCNGTGHLEDGEAMKDLKDNLSNTTGHSPRLGG
jgi:hypothetical protein